MNEQIAPHAKDINKDLQEFIRNRINELPPSEQKKVDPDVYQALKTVGVGKKIFFGAYNIRNSEECYHVESVLNNKALKILSTSMSWSPSGDLIYMMVVEMSVDQYEVARAKFYNKDRKKDQYPFKKTLRRRFTDWCKKIWNWRSPKEEPKKEEKGALKSL